MSDPYRPMPTDQFARLLYDTSAGCSQAAAVAEYRELLAERTRLRTSFVELQEMMGPKFREQFVMQGMRSFVAVMHVVDRALKSSLGPQ